MTKDNVQLGYSITRLIVHHTARCICDHQLSVSVVFISILQALPEKIWKDSRRSSASSMISNDKAYVPTRRRGTFGPADETSHSSYHSPVLQGRTVFIVVIVQYQNIQAIGAKEHLVHEWQPTDLQSPK